MSAGLCLAPWETMHQCIIWDVSHGGSVGLHMAPVRDGWIYHHCCCSVPAVENSRALSMLWRRLFPFSALFVMLERLVGVDVFWV